MSRRAFTIGPEPIIEKITMTEAEARAEDKADPRFAGKPWVQCMTLCRGSFCMRRDGHKGPCRGYRKQWRYA